MRSSSSPPSPTVTFPRRPSNDDHAISSNLEDSVRSLSLTARRRLVKRRSGGGCLAPKMDSFGALLGKDVTPRLNLHNETSRRPGAHTTRTPSFSKRTASLDSPRETSFPSSASNGQTSGFPFGAVDTDPRVSDSDLLVEASAEKCPPQEPTNGNNRLIPNSSAETTPRHLPTPPYNSDAQMRSGSLDDIGICSERQVVPPDPGFDPPNLSPSMSSNGSSLVLASSRPTSVPQPIATPARVEFQTNPYWPDRNSSASLPLPSHTPFTTLLSPSAASTRDYLEQNLSPKIRPPPPTEDSEHRPEQSPLYPRLDSMQLRPPDIANSTASYPPPAPPTILTPPSTPPPCEGNDRPRLPYEPFLSNAPASDDCSIAVETLPSMYVLTVSLPGFRRDGITLATRRRRILHLVADSWETGGGHFERRISFGYDADLCQVRAEFDGEKLRVNIPRRITPAGDAWFFGPMQQ